jgi:predicted transcriptional regulator
MMPYTTELVTAVITRQNVPKDEFASFVGDIHRAMMDISFHSIAIADSLGVSVGIDVSGEPQQPVKPARGASVSSIVQSLLRPKETLFEPPVPHSVRVPSVSVAPPSFARAPEPVRPAHAPQVAKPVPQAKAPVPPAVPTPPAPQQSPLVAKASPTKASPSAGKRAASTQTSLPFEANPAPAPVFARTAPAATSPATARGRGKKYEGPERRSVPLADKPALDFGPLLPRKLTSIEEALTEDYIICLEDGKMVKDLEEYLRKKGQTPQQYRAKWKLPPEYPMIAPNALLKRGAVHEMDPVSGKIVRARI